MPSTDLATRALIVALKSPLYGKTSVEIEVQTGVKERTINNIYARAIKAGFDPNARPMIICNEWLADKPRSGRPAKLGDELNQIVTEKVSTDRYGREKSAAQIADEISQSGAILVSESTAVISSDETAVVLLQRRGGYRIWRKPEEALVKSCIRERWKGYTEFMFWGCFTYNRKGPCHAWGPETAAQRKAANAAIAALNEELELVKQAEWELENGMERLGLRNLPGRKPQ
ncbi:hypothetical protein PG995_005463 [Apiospora arundinis]